MLESPTRTEPIVNLHKLWQHYDKTAFKKSFLCIKIKCTKGRPCVFTLFLLIAPLIRKASNLNEIIIDKAHNIEDVSCEAASLEMSLDVLQTTLEQLSLLEKDEEVDSISSKTLNKHYVNKKNC